MGISIISGHLPCAAISIAAIAILLRIAYVLYFTGKPLIGKPANRVRTLIILGSGGHTAEMINLLTVFQMDRFAPRAYVAAMTDNMSLQKARTFEDSLVSRERSADKVHEAQYMQIYRSREVGQSYISSIWTTLIAIAHAFWLTLRIRPEVVICNGPGTCIPLCASAFFFKLFGEYFSSYFRAPVTYFCISRWFMVIGLKWSSIFYVESIARVRRLSLSGLLLYKATSC